MIIVDNAVVGYPGRKTMLLYFLYQGATGVIIPPPLLGRFVVACYKSHSPTLKGQCHLFLVSLFIAKKHIYIDGNAKIMVQYYEQ